MPYVLSESSVKLAYRKNLLSVRATYNGGQGEAERKDTTTVGIDPDSKELVNEKNTQNQDQQNQEDDEVIRNVGD